MLQCLAKTIEIVFVHVFLQISLFSKPTLYSIDYGEHVLTKLQGFISFDFSAYSQTLLQLIVELNFSFTVTAREIRRNKNVYWNIKKSI